MQLIDHCYVVTRCWIIHDTPRYIACKGHDLKKDFFSGSGVTYDLFDICVRRFLQLDNQIYPEDSPLRWRHMLESDFAVRTKILNFNNYDYLPLMLTMKKQNLIFRCMYLEVKIHQAASLSEISLLALAFVLNCIAAAWSLFVLFPQLLLI
jgi:hypothetical protein